MTNTFIVDSNAGISGSLTNLVDGTSYLIAGDNVNITSQSNGSVVIGTIIPMIAPHGSNFYLTSVRGHVTAVLSVVYVTAFGGGGGGGGAGTQVDIAGGTCTRSPVHGQPPPNDLFALVERIEKADTFERPASQTGCGRHSLRAKQRWPRPQSWWWTSCFIVLQRLPWILESTRARYLPSRPASFVEIFFARQPAGV